MSITFEIPKGLQELLQDFTVAVLKEKPSELIPFAAEYFNELNGRDSSLLPGTVYCASNVMHFMQCGQVSQSNIFYFIYYMKVLKSLSYVAKEMSIYRVFFLYVP